MTDAVLCLECGRRPVAAPRWQASRGLCDPCYSKLHKQNRLPPLPRRTTPENRSDCHHPRVTHVHGTYRCYSLDRCRCDDCRAACREHSRDSRRRAAAQAFGSAPAIPEDLVDAAPARERLRALTGAGMGLRQIAAASGVERRTLGAVLAGSRHRVHRRLLDRMLAVRYDPAEGSRVDGTGTARRLQALVATGWAQNELADKLGINPSRINRIVRAKNVNVTVATRKAVNILYDELKNRDPKTSQSRSRTRARKAGWAPPSAWDDDTIDDPAAAPATAKAAAKRCRRLDLDELEFLLDNGQTGPKIIAQTGVSRDAIRNSCKRNRPELWDRFKKSEIE